ncbi:unnamed protein product [Heligmosomoides polygyrus]|uniref:Uncharacterized protein n=1 Tax=Heligmosomoides polygyrus TaxID=6339 RepID=A0A183FYR8_HELPZ|nr:unnamed protein product [Heligmosomoides polygyrus]
MSTVRPNINVIAEHPFRLERLFGRKRSSEANRRRLTTASMALPPRRRRRRHRRVITTRNSADWAALHHALYFDAKATVQLGAEPNPKSISGSALPKEFRQQRDPSRRTLAQFGFSCELVALSGGQPLVFRQKRLERLAEVLIRTLHSASGGKSQEQGDTDVSGELEEKTMEKADQKTFGISGINPLIRRTKKENNEMEKKVKKVIVRTKDLMVGRRVRTRKTSEEFAMAAAAAAVRFPPHPGLLGGRSQPSII